MIHATQNCMVEWSYASGKAYADPFNEVELDVLVTDAGGEEQRAPAFWAGDQTWRVRYAAAQAGTHSYRTVCSDEGNADLHGREGTIEVAPYEGDNPLLSRGPLQVAENRRYLQHADGTPFFWLADTWWMGLCKRLRWPEDFRVLMADRVAKGFSVIQIVAGLYPDMPYLDERGANEAGFPWTEGYGGINPAYYDMADLRIGGLVDAGLVPCIVSCWGYFLVWMGVERMKRHWRYLVARYGAYPVVWCLAGEGVMPYYLSEHREQDAEAQKRGWTELAAYVREIDPYRRPVSIHPTSVGREQVEDAALLDFDMLQTGHGDRQSIPNTVNLVVRGHEAEPRMPVLNSEVCYEGIMEASRQEIQRFMFWACMLSGACGHTYGANGIWQVNEPGKPYGPSPHGSSWGDRPWTEAYRLPGSGEVGLGKRLLERYPWWRMEPHPEWTEPRWTTEHYWQPYAAGIPGELRVIYMPHQNPPRVRQLEAGAAYRAVYIDPSDGSEIELGRVEGDAEGSWPAPKPPIFRDWVLVLERA
jgi:hypothetical protein